MMMMMMFALGNEYFHLSMLLSKMNRPKKDLYNKGIFLDSVIGGYKGEKKSLSDLDTSGIISQFVICYIKYKMC
jgi:hypothetical protein